jgi:hypothetical protein|tara:strand:+ start:1840 stop:2205 length:366 start_codon:yes stop_codon:yes gene_type:complete
MKKITKKFLRELPIEEGDLCRVRWPDAACDGTADGSPKEILRDHETIVYDTYGLYLGLAKVTHEGVAITDLVMTSDKRVWDGKAEHRGSLSIPLKMIMEIEVIRGGGNASKVKRQGRPGGT